MNEKELSDKARWLGRKIPQELLRKAIIRENPLEEQKYKFEKVIETGKWRGKLIKREDQKKVAEVYRRTNFDKKVEKIDPVVAEKIDKAMEQIVREEIHKGNFRPEEIRRDPFVIERYKNRG